MAITFESWGRYSKGVQEELLLQGGTGAFPASGAESYLPIGQGRSYGDVCLNFGGAVIHTRRLNRLIQFDPNRGLLTCEGGVTLAEVLEFAIPRGWFLPVTPGTKYVSVGGAIANDVHGKNHHRRGAFGCFVRDLVLLRSDDSQLRCAPNENPELFSATIGGLGLTGIIVSATMQLKKIVSSFIAVESVKFSNLEEFFAISKDAHSRFEYTVSWLDCIAKDRNFGRGIFMGGNHSVAESLQVCRGGVKLSIPFNVPGIFLKTPTMKFFNAMYYRKQFKKRVFSTVSYDPFFYPLDSVLYWNRLYGKNGFFQFQCILDRDGVRRILLDIVTSGAGSFLAVLKEFGSIPSPGMMSFPKPGVSLSLDFANQGPKTVALLKRLDAFVRENGGRVYPGKDVIMAPESFRRYFPRWEEFSKHIDPKFSSSFWRRVTAS